MKHTQEAHADLARTTTAYCRRFGHLAEMMEEALNDYLGDPLVWSVIKALVQVQAYEEGPEE